MGDDTVTDRGVREEHKESKGKRNREGEEQRKREAERMRKSERPPETSDTLRGAR